MALLPGEKMSKKFAMMVCLACFVVSWGLAGPAFAASKSPAKSTQGPGAVMFILDASGSMWGQIKGKPKIAIAKEVMKKLVDGLPDDLLVGLSTYGHRSRDDCKDIQTLIKPSPLDRQAFKARIDAINPKGKTPLSDAVRQAAQELRYTEERATVVLVSDGLETCAADPCALAAELAKAGVDFTVHVIGFAISKDEQERLRCLADRTGGLFLSADDAQGLQKALTATVEKVREAPKPVVQDPGKATLQGPAAVQVGQTFQVKWQGPDSQGDYVALSLKDSRDNEEVTYAYTRTGNPVRLTAPGDPGDYQLRYVHGHTGKVIGRAPLQITPAKASIKTPTSVQAGQMIPVNWSGPGYQGDYISIAKPDQNPSSYVYYTYVSQGNPLSLQAPSDPGTYEVRYILKAGDKLLVKAAIEITPAAAQIQAPASASMGAKFKVSWTGPGNQGDYISIAQPEQEESAYLHYTYVRTGNPLTLQAPSQPGEYEVRYILGVGDKLLAKTSIRIEEVKASVQAPASASMGAKFKVSWTGPGNQGDYISIAQPEQEESAYLHYTYVRTGNPLTLQAPTEPGTYEVRYILGVGDKLLAKTSIRIEEVKASVQAPASVDMGSKFKVSWTGPGNQGDYISIAQPEQEESAYLHYTYVRTGNPITLQAPSQPGEYEVRYLLGQGNKLLAKTSIRIEEVKASVQAPASVDMGSKFKVSWTGPGNQEDYITIAQPEQEANAYLHYTYVRTGNPLTLQAPTEPGTYEVRYILGQGEVLLGKQAIQVK